MYIILYVVSIMELSVIVLSLFVALLWGTAPVIHKHVLKKTPTSLVMVVGGISYMICLFVFAIYNKDELLNGYKKLEFVTIGWIAVTSIFTAFVANLVYFYVLKKHDSYVISALIYCSPIFTLILAYMFLKEKITILGFIGVILIVLGVICLALNEKPHKIEQFADYKSL